MSCFVSLVGLFVAQVTPPYYCSFDSKEIEIEVADQIGKPEERFGDDVIPLFEHSNNARTYSTMIGSTCWTINRQFLSISLALGSYSQP